MYLYKTKIKEDDNFYIYFDTETSPIYCIRKNKKQLVENCINISLEQYITYQTKNKLENKIIYDIFK